METKSSRSFFAWDLITVAQLVHPELFTTSEVECDVLVEGASQGRVVRTAGINKVGGGDLWHVTAGLLGHGHCWCGNTAILLQYFRVFREQARMARLLRASVTAVFV